VHFIQRNPALFIGDLWVGHRVIHLGRQRYAIPAAVALAESAADDLLGTALRPVDVGRIEDIDPDFQGAVHNLVGFFFACPGAKVHRPQTDLAHLRIGSP
jgi:hypothetical protein